MILSNSSFSDIKNPMSHGNDNNVVHRPSALKQQNKPFKTGCHDLNM